MKYLLLVYRFLRTLLYFVTPRKICLYRCVEGVNRRNFGDELNMFMLKKITNKAIFLYQDILPVFGVHAFLIIGSILDTPPRCSYSVYGSGYMYGNYMISRSPRKVCFVRGINSASVLRSNGIHVPDFYADPVMIIPRFYSPKIVKNSKVGIVPHYVDFDRVLSLVEHDDDFLVINVLDNPLQVINNICSCKAILSSSLHGLIVADAYKIPNVWIKLSDDICGGDFKFFDYYSSIKRCDIKSFFVTSKEDVISALSSAECSQFDQKVLDQVEFALSSLN